MSTVQQDSADFLDNIPKHIFKQVNHFIHTLARVNFLYLLIRHNKAYVYAHNFSVCFFSSSGTQQSHYLDGCEATRINSFLICAFWAFRFL